MSPFPVNSFTRDARSRGSFPPRVTEGIPPPKLREFEGIHLSRPCFLVSSAAHQEVRPPGDSVKECLIGRWEGEAPACPDLW